jgi:hypothetical protein
VNCGTDCADTAPVAAVPASLGTLVQPQNIHPTAPEVCNGVDDNCIGGIDEGDPGGGGVCANPLSQVCAPATQHCRNGALTCVPNSVAPPLACCAGFGNCDGNVNNGCEANLAIDTSNCGTCGTHCPTTGGTPACVSGTCGFTSCGAGLTSCGGSCVNVASDRNNCGACGHACPSTYGTPVCTGGVCGYSACTAASGRTLCGAQCVDEQSDPTNCGACGNLCPVVAGGTATCATGACSAACSSGLTGCGASCVDLSTDTNSCGACGHACSNTGATYAACASSTCTPSCATGRVDCSTPAAPDPDDGCECLGTACCALGCQSTFSDGAGERYYSCRCDPTAACMAYARVYGGTCTTTRPAGCTTDLAMYGSGSGCGTPYDPVCTVYSSNAASECSCWDSRGYYHYTVDAACGRAWFVIPGTNIGC